MSFKKMDGMRVAKIRNRYMFKHKKGADPRGFHYYLVYHDKNTGKDVAVKTTHLYNKDFRRFQELSSGRGIKMCLPGLETPSLVTQKTYIYNSKDKSIDFAHRDVYVKAKLSRSKARRVYKFINQKNKK